MYLLLELLCSKAVITRHSDTHVDRSDDIEGILNDEEDDSTNIHSLTAEVITAWFAVCTLKWRLSIEHPVRAKDDYDHVDG